MSMLTKKILMLVPSPFFADRGCHVRIYEEFKALRKRGHQVRLLTYHLGRDLADVKVDRTINVPWYRKEEAGPSVHKLYLDLFLLAKALWLMVRFKPDLIHAHLHEGAFVGRILGLLFRVPLAFDFQGSLLAELQDHGVARGGLLAKLVTVVERWITRGCGVVFTSSAQAKALLHDSFACPASQVVNVPDGIDPQRKPGNSTAVRASLGIPESAKVVVYMGTLNQLEGADLLIDIAAEVCRKTEHAHFLVIGYPNVDHYRHLAALKDLSARMTFTGRVPHEETFALLGLSDVAISPKISRTEGNLKLCYYMQSGLPTVVFDNDVNRELLGEYGYYAPDQDWWKMAHEVVALVSGYYDIDRDAIRQQVLNNYSMDRLVELIEEGYERIL